MARAGFGEHDWVFDLIDADPARREAALARHVQLLTESAHGQEWVNRVWARAGGPAPEEPQLAREMSLARRAHQVPREQTVYGPLDAFCGMRSPIAADAYAVLGPFVVLFLTWERRFPDQWRQAGACTWSPWGTKELLLAQLSRQAIPAELHTDLIGLTVASVLGPYRCKDWMYTLVARRVDEAALRTGLAAVGTATQPDQRLRAEFVLDALDHPDRPITRRSWRHWCSSPGSPGAV